MLLDEDAGLKFKPGRHSEIFMGGAGVTVTAAVQTATVGIEAVTKRDVRAVVFRDDGFRLIIQVDRLRPRQPFQKLFVKFQLLEILYTDHRQEPILRIRSRSPSHRPGPVAVRLGTHTPPLPSHLKDDHPQ